MNEKRDLVAECVNKLYVADLHHGFQEALFNNTATEDNTLLSVQEAEELGNISALSGMCVSIKKLFTECAVEIQAIIIRKKNKLIRDLKAKEQQQKFKISDHQIINLK